MGTYRLGLSIIRVIRGSRSAILSTKVWTCELRAAVYSCWLACRPPTRSRAVWAASVHSRSRARRCWTGSDRRSQLMGAAHRRREGEWLKGAAIDKGWRQADKRNEFSAFQSIHRAVPCAIRWRPDRAKAPQLSVLSLSPCAAQLSRGARLNFP